MTSNKVYVDVYVEITKDGIMMPKMITWEDGRRYEITRVKDRQRAASLKAGGAGIRYTVIVQNKEVFLYLEEDKFFMERRTG